MKYEMSEGQYVDFLNCLTRAQQQPHVTSDISGDLVSNYYVMSGNPSLIHGNTIHCPETGNGTIDPIGFFSSAPDRACGFTDNYSTCAFLDWCALRPMTCFEYEKSCRGANIAPVGGEFAWGTNYASYSLTTVENEGSENEKFVYSYNGMHTLQIQL